MTLKTRQIRITLKSPTGAAIANTEVQASLTSYEIDGLMIVPTVVRGTTDATGTVLLDLWPNSRGTAGSQYNITSAKSGALLLNVMATVPDGDAGVEVPLEAIITSIAPPTVNDAQLAVLQAQHQVDLATAQATAAHADAEQTGLDRTATGQDKTGTSGDRVQTGLDRTATGQDKTATASDRVQTGLDRSATGQDLTGTAADRVQTGLDRTATDQDKTGTAADRVQTGLDRTATGQDKTGTAADRVQTGLDRTATGLDKTATAADRVQTGLDRTAAAGNAATATAQNTAAGTSAGAAATSATQAAAARDLSIAAWASSTAPAETLAAMSQSLHFGTIVDICIDEPWRHSDGGAWTDRCQDKSWYTETLGGDRWIGQRATVAAAWTAAGSAVGAVFLATTTAGPCTAGRFYQATSSTTVTEVFRGIRREYPKSGIVWFAESARVVGYEVATGAMWMVFLAGTSPSAISWIGAATITSIAALKGELLVGNTTTGFIKFDFCSDGMRVGFSTNWGITGLISTRNVAHPGVVGGPHDVLPNNAVIDVAITVLPGAPIDPATGLPTSTVAIGTSSGMSVIRHDGVVITAMPYAALTTDFDANGTAVSMGENNRHIRKTFAPAYTTFTASTVLDGLGSLHSMVANSNKTIAKKGLLAYPRSIGGITVIKDNYSTFEKGMAANIGSNYNTGWQVGDSRLCALADTVAETVTGATILSATFAGTGNLDGFTIFGSGTNNNGVNVLDITTAVGTNSASIRVITGLIAGRTYVICFDRVNGTTASAIYVNEISPVYSSAAGTYTATFVAAGTSTQLYLNGGGSSSRIIFANIFVKLADPDRSVKNNGLILNGILTKTAVASGAALVAYSGFSASNYLEQPYNANLDFGPGDFYVMGWVTAIANSGVQTLVSRATAGQGAPYTGVLNLTLLNNQIEFRIGTSYMASGVVVPVGSPVFVCVSRTAGVVSAGVNGVQSYSVANAVSLTLADARMRLGCSAVDGTSNLLTGGSLALWRIGATAPTADQIAQIYRDELPLFQPGAQCTIAGSSTAVTAMAYDESTDLLHVGTSWGRTSFKGLLRVDSEATAVGAITALAASGGTVLTGGTNAIIYQPALRLRDELRRREIAAKALGQMPVFFEFDTASFSSPTTSGSTALTASSIVGTPYVGMGITGTGIPAGTTLVAINGTAYTMSAAATVTNAGAVAIGQASFTLQQGYTARAVYSAEAIKREGSTKTYTRANDGYRETINFAVSPGSATWVSIMAVRA